VQLEKDPYQGMPSGMPAQLQDLKPASAAGAEGQTPAAEAASC
jgi:hypothetical protein